jgi:hypothetical protein
MKGRFCIIMKQWSPVSVSFVGADRTVAGQTFASVRFFEQRVPDELEFALRRSENTSGTFSFRHALVCLTEPAAVRIKKIPRRKG